MPTPPLPSRDDSPVPLPADCRVETLALWLQREGGITYVESARAVRALLEERVRLAVRYCSYDDETDAHVADVVRHVIGSPS